LNEVADKQLQQSEFVLTPGEPSMSAETLSVRILLY
jgi:hypothetical protein